VQIQDLESFLIAEVPYGQVDPRQIRQGIIERVGLARDGSVTDPDQLAENARQYSQRLYWQFGDEMCPVVAAVRFEYLYTLPSYSQQTVASLLIGYTAPDQDEPPNAAEVLSQASNGGLQRIACSFGTRTDDHTLSDFLAHNSPYFESTFSGLRTDPRYVEIRGLARDYDSLRALPYTWSDVAADPSKLDELVYWTFGDISYRICKAVRVYYGDGHLPPSLLIGYHGPGGN
jgi:hypothetical protein